MPIGREAAIVVRRLEPTEWGDSHEVMGELGYPFDRDEFVRRVRLQSHAGYELAGAFRNGALVGMIGMRPVHTMGRGPHLHVDDLVVTAAERGSGSGRALMEFAEAQARARGMNAVFLDARSEAIGFYERGGYVRHHALSMKKMLAPEPGAPPHSRPEAP